MGKSKPPSRRMDSLTFVVLGVVLVPLVVLAVVLLVRIGPHFAAGADNFLMILVTDEQNLIALLGVTDGLAVDLGDERAGGIDGGEIA